MSPESEYEVAIPSHARPHELNTKTLRLLADRGVPSGRVRVFVAPDEVKEYGLLLDPGLYASIEAGGTSVASQDAIIQQSYPQGTRLVHFDDDIADVRYKVDDKTHAPVQDLRTVFDRGFAETGKHNTGLWGVYSVLNPMFMKNRTSVGLYFCIGHLFGTIVNHDPGLRLNLRNKEDYERTLQYWDYYGNIVRLDDVVCKTRLYARGGMQATDRPDRRILNEEAVSSLMARFPKVVRISSRVNEHVGAELRLVNPRG